MGFRWGFYSLIVSAYLVAVTLALPSSLVEEIKNSEMKSVKVKRAPTDHNGHTENVGRMSYFNSKPTSAIKRGTNLKDADLSDWTGDQLYRNPDFNIDNVHPGLFGSSNLPLDDKTIAEYEKGYRYGANKDNLDETLENAVLKGDFYSDPYSYRYYGADDRRRRRDVSSLNKKRSRRNIDLTPEEVLALLALYENNQRALKESDNYRQPVIRYNKNYDPYDFDIDNNDETWSSGPVYPHVALDQLPPDNYLFDYPNQQPDYKPRWGPVEDSKKKRLF